MIRKMMLAAALVATFALPSSAKNLAVPEKNPAATISIPDSWELLENDFGYSAVSEDEEVIFSIESASGARIDKLFESNEKWMIEQEIVPKGKAVEEELTIGGIPAKVFTYQATDAEGDTVIDFVVLPAGNNRIMLITLWASEEGRAANKAEISDLLMSIKAIK
ncbi:MAG: hypothetical protein RIQ68_667 [Pseudomonadota bacterium]|jgi:hypothetical protein